jgi:hypothetical protein
VLREDRLVSFADGKTALEFRSGCDDAFHIQVSQEGLRYPPSGTPYEPDGFSGVKRHRIIRPIPDGPIIAQECVGNTGKTLDGFFVIDRDRLITQVPAGEHDEIGVQVSEDEMMNGCIRKHDTECAQMGTHFSGDCCMIVSKLQQDDGSPGRREGRRLLISQPAYPTTGIDVSSHDGEGLPFPQLAFPELRHRRCIACVTCKVKSPNALHRKDSPGFDHLCRSTDHRIRATDL